MLLILLLAFGLGTQGLNADVFWADELSSVTHMGAFNPLYTPAQIMESMSKYAPDHVPLYNFLGAGWAQLAGWSQFSLRLISCFFGVLMVAWLYRFAADAVNRRTALVAACLMSTAAFILLYFHELRMYTLFMLLAIMHTWLYWRLAHGFRVARLSWILFILTAALLFYTHNFAMFLFVGLGMYHLLLISKSRRWFYIMLGWGLGALLFLPYAPYALEGILMAAANNLRAYSVPAAAAAFAHLMVNGFDFLWLPLALSFGYALWRLRDPVIARLLSIALIMIAVFLLVSWQFQFILTTRMRYVLILWFPFVILFAWGLTSVPRWRAVTALFILLWSVAGWQLGRSINILDYAGVRTDVRTFPPLHDYADNLGDKVKYQDYLIGFSARGYVNEPRKPGWSTADYYWSTADYYLKARLGIDGIFLHTSLKRYRLERDVRDILREHPHVLLAHNPRDVPLNYAKTLGFIQQDYIPCAVPVAEPDLLIQRYVHPVMGCHHQPAPVDYGDSIRVIDRAARYEASLGTVQALIWWEVPDEGLLNEYNISMQILTPAWRNVRQTDVHLYDDMPPWDVMELSTAGLSPGDYRLVMIVYHRDSGEKISGLDLVTGETAAILPVLEFTVEPDS